MGIGPGRKYARCSTNHEAIAPNPVRYSDSSCRCHTNHNAIAPIPLRYSKQDSLPNPNPANWQLIQKEQFKNGYVLKVHYRGCTNFEGYKVMVYKGQYVERDFLDPHFQDDPDAPIARFAPTDEGWSMALNLAKSL